MIFETVRKNKIKTTFIVSLFFSFITLCIYFLIFNLYKSINISLIVGILFSLVCACIAYYNCDQIILNINNAHEIDREAFLQLSNSLEGLSIAAGVSTPKLYIMDTNAINAFSTGRSPQNSIICVTKGLLDNLDKYEIEGVLAHELSHIRNYDTLLSTIAIVMLCFINILCSPKNKDDSLSYKYDEAHQSFVTSIAASIILSIFAGASKILNLFVSRNREYLADASAVELTRNKQGLISALNKIDASTIPMPDTNEVTESLFIINPYKKQTGSMWDTHPITEDRIKKLQNLN
jgi:heat shock protein HtpX